MAELEFYDVTLRDGAQSEGISFSYGRRKADVPRTSCALSKICIRKGPPKRSFKSYYSFIRLYFFQLFKALIIIPHFYSY